MTSGNGSMRSQTRRGKRPPRQQRFRDYVRKKPRGPLQPAQVTDLQGVWRKMESLGITEKDVEELKKGQQQILQQIQELKQLLQAQAQARPAAPNVKDVVFNLGANPVRGKDEAKLTLVEFTDYQ